MSSTTIHANARPEKRLFISLITRDISLIEALLDIIDNSINAALEPLAATLKTADDYQKLLANNRLKPKVEISIRVSPSRITVVDTASGISWRNARDHVFKFGRAEDEAEPSDRLSVYGIGLKRAIFKCGNKIRMMSDHRDGGFSLKLDVAEWAGDKSEPWSFEIVQRPPSKTELGTSIEITDLYDDVRRRVDDGLFLDQLTERISRTYSFYIGRVIEITVNDKSVPRELFEIGDNHTSEKFRVGKVSCNVTAGLASTTGDRFRERHSGWHVFCNGRAVIFADKSALTGWGAGLPIFQPKHRPFLGTVFFVSADPEELPWTTTKGSINEENSSWQVARRHMVAVGRVITGFLDKRYTEDGTDIKSSDLQEAAGERMSVLTAAVATSRSFKPPKTRAPTEVRIQYSAKVKDLKRIENYLRRPGMGGSAVGRHTFNFFLENEVGGEE